MDKILSPLLHYLPDWVGQELDRFSGGQQGVITELRLHREKPVILCLSGSYPALCSRKLTSGELEQTLLRFCDYSMQSCQDQLRQGYIALPGGHRVGVCGQAVYRQGKFFCLDRIQSANLRLARPITGLAQPVLACFFPWKQPPSLLLAGEPGSGKTTLARDLARSLSRGELAPGVPVAVIDPRGELGGCPDFLGDNADLFSGYSKTDAMEIALRTMAPRVMVCDEIGGEEETPLLRQCFQSGVSVIATAHASQPKQLFARPVLGELLRAGCFDGLVMLSSQSPSVAQTIQYKKELTR